MSSSDPYGWFWGYYATGAWEPETKALIDTLQPGDLFVDVGAWIGPVTLWALERGARVIAIEPDPVALGELRRTVPSEVEIWEGAVTAHGGPARLARNARDGGFYGDSMSWISDQGRPVKSWTLPHILNGRRASLVKIDVEGYELQLLPVLAPWLAEHQVPVQVSFHGALPDRDWFAGYRHVKWPADEWGDLVARP